MTPYRDRLNAGEYDPGYMKKAAKPAKKPASTTTKTVPGLVRSPAKRD